MSEMPLVALAGPPNCGKTTLFNALSGANAKVGNYSGITVERREGRLWLGDQRVRLVDVPGTHSLNARTAEEQIAVSVLTAMEGGERPDALLLMIDATQIARHLYFVLQVLELGLPVIVVLNMIDEVERSEMRVDAEKLEAELGVPVVAISAAHGRGLDPLRRRLQILLRDPEAGRSHRLEPADVGVLAEDLAQVGAQLPAHWVAGQDTRRAALARWALLSLGEDDELVGVPQPLRELAGERRAAAVAAGRDLDMELVTPRWTHVDTLLDRVLEGPRSAARRLTDAVDAVLTHPISGLLVFLIIMGLLFESLFAWSGPAIDAIDGVFGALGESLAELLPAGFLTDLLTEGIVAGVGAVLVFLPQILLLFLFLSLLEDSGYMARAAALMDRLMKAMGLTGRAFVPMLSGFACAIPAIMATRTMERRRERLLVMMVVPLTTCSARLPVYTLIIAALFPGPDEPGGQLIAGFSLQSGLMIAFYILGTALAIGAAGVFGRTILKGSSPPLVLELPPYRLPRPRSVLRTMWERSRLFVSEAGRVILVITVLLWLLLSFPGEPAAGAPLGAEGGSVSGIDLVPSPSAGAAAESDDLEGEAGAVAGASESAEALAAAELAATTRLRNSYAGRLGRWMEPAIEPLGFDWRIGIGLLGSFAAREVFVSTMGVVYGVGDEVDEQSSSLKDGLRDARWPDGRLVFTPLVGLSLMIFFAFAAQCMSTLAVVKRETGGWRWPSFMFAYMTALAWIASFLVYQGGLALGFS